MKYKNAPFPVVTTHSLCSDLFISVLCWLAFPALALDQGWGTCSTQQNFHYL